MCQVGRSTEEHDRFSSFAGGALIRSLMINPRKKPAATFKDIKETNHEH